MKLSTTTIRSHEELAAKLRILVSRGGAVPLSFAQELLEQIHLRDAQHAVVSVVTLPTLKLPARQTLDSEIVLLTRKIAKQMNSAEQIAEQIHRGPGAREIALAITRLQEAKMWAEQGIKEIEERRQSMISSGW